MIRIPLHNERGHVTWQGITWQTEVQFVYLFDRDADLCVEIQLPDSLHTTTLTRNTSIDVHLSSGEACYATFLTIENWPKEKLLLARLHERLAESGDARLCISFECFFWGTFPDCRNNLNIVADDVVISMRVGYDSHQPDSRNRRLVRAGVTLSHHATSEERVIILLEDIRTMLQFCFGTNVSQMVVHGRDANGELKFQLTGETHMEAVPVHGYWYPTQNHLGVHSADTPYSKLFSFIRGSQSEAIRQVLRWYLAANVANADPCISLVAVQTAFERLTWHLLIEKRRIIKTEDADYLTRKLTVAEQIRLLLTFLDLDACIPEEEKQLLAIVPQSGVGDFPEALTSLRNKIVHPGKQAKTAKRDQLSGLPVDRCLLVALQLLDLCLLHLSGYEGWYCPRSYCHLQGMASIQELVPWIVESKVTGTDLMFWGYNFWQHDYTLEVRNRDLGNLKKMKQAADYADRVSDETIDFRI